MSYVSSELVTQVISSAYWIEKSLVMEGASVAQVGEDLEKHFFEQ